MRNKALIIAATTFIMSASAQASDLLGSSCQPISSTEYLVSATASGTLSSAATLSIGTNTGLIGDIESNNTKISYVGTIDCDGASISIVDGSTSYTKNLGN